MVQQELLTKRNDLYNFQDIIKAEAVADSSFCLLPFYPLTNQGEKLGELEQAATELFKGWHNIGQPGAYKTDP